MKPTKEIIELAEKLKQLGYKQEIEIGGWCLNIEYEIVCNWDIIAEDKGFDKDEYLPIPSIEDGLKWIEENYSKTRGRVFSLVYIDTSAGNEWRVNLIGGGFNTPHEAVLKAMIKVLESK